jgi:hypothetical protein
MWELAPALLTRNASTERQWGLREMRKLLSCALTRRCSLP